MAASDPARHSELPHPDGRRYLQRTGRVTRRGTPLAPQPEESANGPRAEGHEEVLLAAEPSTSATVVVVEHTPGVPRFLRDSSHSCVLFPMTARGRDGRQRSGWAGRRRRTLTAGDRIAALGAVARTTIVAEGVGREADADVEDTPPLSYHDAAAGSLCYATRDGSGFETTEIAPAGWASSARSPSALDLEVAVDLDVHCDHRREPSTHRLRSDYLWVDPTQPRRRR